MEVLVQVEKRNIKGLPENLLNDKDYELIIEYPINKGLLEDNNNLIVTNRDLFERTIGSIIKFSEFHRIMTKQIIEEIDKHELLCVVVKQCTWKEFKTVRRRAILDEISEE